MPLGRPFSSLRSENSLIDVFFERRERDHAGGETGKVIGQIRSRPAYGLTYGRMRGATWFDKTMPPQGIVWLLGAEKHDERHKGRSDAYDILGALDAAGQLFPQPIDYERLELDRRLLDSQNFADDARRDSRQLIEKVLAETRAEGEIARVPCRLVFQKANGLAAVFAAVSVKPVVGDRSGLPFPLTNERFLLLAEAVRAAAEDLLGPEVLAEEDPRFPGGLDDERGFVLVFELESGEGTSD